jgi:hypothetical protein
MLAMLSTMSAWLHAWVTSFDGMFRLLSVLSMAHESNLLLPLDASGVTPLLCPGYRLSRGSYTLEAKGGGTPLGMEFEESVGSEVEYLMYEVTYEVAGRNEDFKSCCKSARSAARSSPRVSVIPRNKRIKKGHSSSPADVGSLIRADDGVNQRRATGFPA